MKINIFILPILTYQMGSKMGLAKTESCIVRVTKQSVSFLSDKNRSDVSIW
jgi:hypothetical protein